MIKPVLFDGRSLVEKQPRTTLVILPDGRPVVWFPKRKPDLRMKHIVEIDEGQRQLIMLALAKLSNERPGWDTFIGATAMNFPMGFELFQTFQQMEMDELADAIGKIGT